MSGINVFWDRMQERADETIEALLKGCQQLKNI